MWQWVAACINWRWISCWKRAWETQEQQSSGDLCSARESSGWSLLSAASDCRWNPTSQGQWAALECTVWPGRSVSPLNLQFIPTIIPVVLRITEAGKCQFKAPFFCYNPQPSLAVGRPNRILPQSKQEGYSVRSHQWQLRDQPASPSPLPWPWASSSTVSLALPLCNTQNMPYQEWSWSCSTPIPQIGLTQDEGCVRQCQKGCAAAWYPPCTVSAPLCSIFAQSILQQTLPLSVASQTSGKVMEGLLWV